MANNERLTQGLKSWLLEFLVGCNMIYTISPIFALVFAFFFNKYVGYTLLLIYGFALMEKNRRAKNDIPTK